MLISGRVGSVGFIWFLGLLNSLRQDWCLCKLIYFALRTMTWKCDYGTPTFIFWWSINLCRIRDDIEKEDAFRGLCAMVCQYFLNEFIVWKYQQLKCCMGFLKCCQVKANPSGALSSLVFMCKAIASWHVRMAFLLRYILMFCIFNKKPNGITYLKKKKKKNSMVSHFVHL